MDIVTRKEAKERGLARYFTGKPCPHGHLAERRASTCRCVECDRKYHEANLEKMREASRKYYEANREKERERKRKYHEANPEKIRERHRKYREANREKIRERQRKYRQGGLVEKAKRQRASGAWSRTEGAERWCWPRHEIGSRPAPACRVRLCPLRKLHSRT